MLLSEAIRLGSMASEKCTDQAEDFTGARCALGAALYAVGEKVHRRDWHLQIVAIWPWTDREGMACPADGCLLSCGVVIRDIIWHLNDCHEWSREQIADWVAAIEPPEPAPEPEVVAIEPKATEAA